MLVLAVSHSTCGGDTGKVIGEHCCCTSVARNGMSGSPVAAPALSTQAV